MDWLSDILQWDNLPPVDQSPAKDRFWTPAHETQFQQFMGTDPAVQQWKQAFQQKYGEPPNLQGKDFDYRKAFLAGDRPQTIVGDTVTHWPSSGKMPDHPTLWMQHFMDRFGQDPMDVVRSGKATPEQQNFINQAMQDNMNRDLLRTIKVP